MPRAKKRCAQPGCKQYAPCKTHQVWKPSSGMRPLPSNWKSLAKRVRQRDDFKCKLCGRWGNEVDHIIPRSQNGSDEMVNLRVLCSSCHSKKTEQEKRFGQKRRPASGP